MDIISGLGLELLLRWIHFLAGITWIGLLYYFNFVQGEWFKETDASSKTAAVQKLVPRALWWFRWAALFTFLAGALTLINKGMHGGGGWTAVYASSWGIMILTGSALGTLMFLNVWLIIWPNQQVVIASTNKVADGGEALPEAADCGAKAALASRTNTLFSIPMLLFMGAATHYPLVLPVDTNFSGLFWVLAIIIGLLEVNGIVGKPGPMASVKGVITSGLVLTVVLFGVIGILV
ncbi:MAG: urate hydroxylase PuuD [SAR324 cluster bacterium]|nr:urate hydroxylase PuuD [SAR324 cluster bacterium]MEE3266601.1 urate hydroxylase PuuD [SAR324 cluster bacterium]